jgi:hypothetical protein
MYALRLRDLDFAFIDRPLRFFDGLSACSDGT